MASMQLKTSAPDTSSSRRRGLLRTGALFGAAAATTLLTACSGAPGLTTGSGTTLSGVVRTYQRGYVLSEGALEQVPIGSSQEQVLLVLGTPSTVSVLNGDVFFYISQVQQKVAFLKPEIIEQKVLAVYFDKNRRVTRIANYGLQDGKVFDFVSQTTPTSGAELSILKQLLQATNFSPMATQ
nr:outer membrane protein assembly factor BamE [Aquabacter sp. P-9]